MQGSLKFQNPHIFVWIAHIHKLSKDLMKYQHLFRGFPDRLKGPVRVLLASIMIAPVISCSTGSYEQTSDGVVITLRQGDKSAPHLIRLQVVEDGIAHPPLKFIGHGVVPGCKSVQFHTVEFHSLEAGSCE